MTQKEFLAHSLIEQCTWNNTNLSVKDIIELCEEKQGAKIVFSMIFQNSRMMCEHLKLIKKEWIVDFIKEQKIGKFNERYFKHRKDVLIYFFVDANHKIKDLEWK